MTAHVMPGGDEMNPCCAAWKEKCSKLRVSRNTFRQTLKVLTQHYDNLKAESLEVEKALVEERARADKEKGEKLKELSVKVSLENEISALKSEITLAQQKGPSGVQDIEIEEVRDLQSRVSDMEAEIKRLKKLLDQEKLRADSEKKKASSEKSRAAEAWKLVKAEKSKVDEERRLVDIERKKADEYRSQLESIKKEDDETRSKLAVETLKSKEASERLESEKKKTIKEKKRADSERLKADEQRNLVDEIRRNAVEEKSRVNHLSRQLEKANLEIKELQKARQELLCTLRVADSGNCLQPEMERRDSVKSKYLQPEDVNQLTKVVKNNKAPECQMPVDEPKKKAMKRKYSDQLGHFDVDAETIEKSQKDAHVFEASRRSMQTPENVVDKITKDESERMSLLKKKLKLAKMQVKHAKEVAKLEKSHNHILRQEICHIKREFFIFSHRLGLQDGHFPCCSEGIDDITKSGCFTNMQSLDLHRKLLHMEQSQMCPCPQCKDRTARPSCINSFASDGFKRNVECSAPFLSCSDGVEIIKGTDFKSEPLFGGSVQNLLQCSAINSSAASFSDRQLVGSQGRGAFSVTTSAKLGDKNSKSHTSISNLSGEAIIKVNSNEKDAVVAENSVWSPPHTNTFERVSKKRKWIFDAVGSIEHLYSKEKKLHHQIEEKLYSLHDVLGGLTEKFSEYDGHLAPNVCIDPYMECDKRKNSSIQGGVLQRSHDSDTDKHNGEKLEIEDSGEDRTLASQCANNLTIHAQSNKDRGDDFALSELEIGIAELVDVDYMKLLELDNIIDEERYQMAVKMPLSPTLPDIQLLNVDASKSKCLEKSFCEEILNNLVPSCSSEVMDIEVDSNGLHPSLLGTSYNPLSNQCEDSVGSPISLEQISNELCTSPNSGEAGGQQTKELDPEFSQNNFSYEDKRGTTESSIPMYFIFFSDGMERSSLSRIYHGTRAYVSRFSLSSKTNWLQELLIALLQEKCLLPREKVCVVASFLLHQVSTVAPCISGNFLTRESIEFMHSFTRHICMGMSNVETRRMFANICNLEDLSSLIGEFLIRRKVMMYKDASAESLHRCESRIDTVLDGTFVFLSTGVALNRQLISGSIMFASICVAVGQFGLMCDISFNIFRSQSFDPALVLTILHIFGFLGGKKYMDLNSYSLTMTVIKSMVTFIETNKLSVAATPNEISPVFLPCHKCPFSESVLPVDAVTSLLLYKLQSCTLSGTEDQQSSGLEDFLCITDVPCDESCLNGYLTLSSQSKTALGLNLCNFSDILSLVELIAYTMAWEWMSDKVIPKLLKILESSVQETFSAGIVTLLGQIGRLGVDQRGYENMEVQNLRCRLSAFLGSCTNKKSSLHLEVSTVYALLGLLPFDFEELTRGDVAPPAVASESASADLVRNWFYLLNNEQQSLTLSLFEADDGQKSQGSS